MALAQIEIAKRTIDHSTDTALIPFEVDQKK